MKAKGRRYYILTSPMWPVPKIVYATRVAVDPNSPERRRWVWYRHTRGAGLGDLAGGKPHSNLEDHFISRCIGHHVGYANHGLAELALKAHQDQDQPVVEAGQVYEVRSAAPTPTDPTLYVRVDEVIDAFGKVAYSTPDGLAHGRTTLGSFRDRIVRRMTTDVVKHTGDGVLDITHVLGCGKAYEVHPTSSGLYGSAADFCEHCEDPVIWPERSEVFPGADPQDAWQEATHATQAALDEANARLEKLELALVQLAEAAEHVVKAGGDYGLGHLHLARRAAIQALKRP